MRLVVGAVIVDQYPQLTRVLACRRRDHGLYEFPGGKVEPGESPQQALVRELREELAIKAEIYDEVSGGPFPINEELELRCFYVTAPQPTASKDHDDLRWLCLNQLTNVAWLGADAVVAQVLSGLLRAS